MYKNLKRGEFFGDVRQERTWPEVHLSETHYRPGLQVPQHSHELPYFCLVLQGGFEETFSKTTFACEPFSVVVHPRCERHFGRISPDGSLCFNIELRRSMFSRLYDYAAMPGALADQRGGELNWLALRLYREYQDGDACSPLAIEGMVLEMLAVVARGDKATEKRAPAWLSGVVELLNEEYRESLRLNDVASRIGIHPVHLSRVFRQFHGQSVGDYVRRLRIRFACRQMANPEIGLADVALDAGFADQSQFSRAFKRITGTTPASFRRTLAP